MKHINYFLLTFFIMSAASFAQELPINSEVLYDLGNPGLFFNFQTQEQGVLIIAVESLDVENDLNSDIYIKLYDPYNQEIERIDEDHAGKGHDERGFFIIGAGEYTIEIATLRSQLQSLLNETNLGATLFEDDVNDVSGSTQNIRVAASFMPTAAFTSFLSKDKDDDANPSNAITLSANTEGTSVSVGGKNDPWDWWRVEEGFNIVIISAFTEEGDIALRVYDPNKREDDWLKEDQAINGEENLVIRPENNEPVMLKVTPFYFDDSNEEIHYTIRVEAY